MGNKRALQKAPQLFEGMKNEEALRHLEVLAERLGVQVRSEKGDFRSAGCRVEDKRLVILQKSDAEAAKIETLLHELAALEFDPVELPPPIRKRLTSLREQSQKNIPLMQKES